MNGLLVPFFDTERLVELADRILDSPQDYKHLGQVAVQRIQERYSMQVCLPRMLALYQEAIEEHQARDSESH